MSTPNRRVKQAPRDGLSYSFGLGALAFGGYGLWQAYNALQSLTTKSGSIDYDGKLAAIAPVVVFVGLNVLIRGPSGIDVLNTPGEDKPSKLNIVLMVACVVVGLVLAIYVDDRIRALGYQRSSIFS